MQRRDKTYRYNTDGFMGRSKTFLISRPPHTKKKVVARFKINRYVENIYSDVDCVLPAFVPRYKYLMFFAF